MGWWLRPNRSISKGEKDRPSGEPLRVARRVGWDFTTEVNPSGELARLVLPVHRSSQPRNSLRAESNHGWTPLGKGREAKTVRAGST